MQSCAMHQGPMHCSTFQGNMQAFLLCAAVQASWPRSCATLLQPGRYTFHTALSAPGTNASLRRFGQRAILLLCACSAAQQQWSCASPLTTQNIHSSRSRVTTRHQCTAALFGAKCMPFWYVLLCQQSWQWFCASPFAPIKVCFSHRCVITKHQCTAAGFSSRCIP